jgi:hypothetical protein
LAVQRGVRVLKVVRSSGCCREAVGFLKARGQFLTSPLAPRGKICSLGGMFTASFTPRGEQSLLFTRMEFTPQGITSPQGG